jgi:Ni,Fe-hydrogenase I large subunit
MDDKDFLGYFSTLGSPDHSKLKTASTSIVSTLVALESKIVRKASIDSSDKIK